MAECPGSGFVTGGYVEAHRDTTIESTCTHCWRRVEAVPIEPEWRTDLRIDGEPVEVTRKRVIEHEFGSAWAMRWRRDRVGWMMLLAVVFSVAAVVNLVVRLWVEL